MNRRALLSTLSVAACLGLGGSALKLSFAALNRRDPGRRTVLGIAYGADPRQSLDLYRPDDRSDRRPMVVFFYGGGWTSGRRQDYGWVGQALASRGFLVAVPDYRLVPQVTYPAFVQDGAAAVRWAQDHAAQFGGDPDRLLLMGHSAGAYIALQLALDDDFLQAAGVDRSRIKGAVGLSGPYDMYPFNADYERALFGPYYASGGRATQPISYADRPGRPPVLLIHGAADDDVAAKNSVALDRALRSAGNPSTLRLYPGMGHADTVYDLSRSFAGAAPILDETIAFLTAAAGPTAG